MKNPLSLKRLVVSLGLVLLLTGTAGAVIQDTLRPVGEVYSETGQWPDYPAAGVQWEKIDDVVSDGDDTYLYESDDHDAYIYRADDWGGDGDPDSVEACFLIRKAELMNTFTVAIGRAAAPEAIFQWCGVPDTVTEGTQSYTLFKYMMLTDPCTEAAWTTTSLNSNSYGFGIRYARPETRAVGRYTQGYIVVYSGGATGGNPLLHRKKRMGGIDEADYHNPMYARFGRVW